MIAWKDVREFGLRWGPALFLMLVIFTFSSIPAKDMPGFGYLDLFFKKGSHMLGYALLAQAYLWAIGKNRPNARLIAWLLAILFAVSDEFHQSFVMGRGATVVDVAIDAFGAWVGLVIPALYLLPKF